MFENYAHTEIKGLISKGGQLIDVRSPVEFSQGSIEGAINMPAESIEFFADTIDPSRPIILYSSAGNRSAKVKAFLEARGFEQVYNMGAYRKYVV